MRIKNPGPGAEFAETPWNEIIPGLFMGGHHRRAESGHVVPVVVTNEFDVVISLYSRAGHGPDPGVQHHIAHMPDDPLTPDQLADVTRLADIASAAVTDGKRVLVRCHAGYNRSGLITAQTLYHLGSVSRNTPSDRPTRRAIPTEQRISAHNQRATVDSR